MNAATFRVGWLGRTPDRESGPSVDRGILLLCCIGVTAAASTFVRPQLVAADPIAVLIVLAALCLAVLARLRAPSLAWLAAIGGAYAASTLPISQSRVADPGRLGVEAWFGWAGLAGACALGTMAIAFAYATRPGRRLDPVAVPLATILLGWLALALAVTFVGVANGVRSDPAFTWVDIATVPILAFSPFVVALGALGAAADVRAGVSRARERLGPPESLPARGASASAWALAAATLRELVPGGTAAQDATVAAERTRLAGDLHATVLPALRRAIADAETGGGPDTLARQLRTVDRELERLMADRWPVVLEAFGLVPALEDLAEQVEADGRLQVEIDVEQAGERPPPAVERAAWRVAQLAVDNAVRHAAATTLAITIAVDPARVAVAIADDGRGFDPTSDGAVRPGARGLADAGRRAAEVGATLGIEAGPIGGTRVSFDWAARS